jgi:hypothetical protein
MSAFDPKRTWRAQTDAFKSAKLDNRHFARLPINRRDANMPKSTQMTLDGHRTVSRVLYR